MSSRRLNMRERPISNNKKLPIIISDDNSLFDVTTPSADKGASSSGTASKETVRKSSTASSSESSSPSKKAINILVPDSHDASASYDKIYNTIPKYSLPKYYVKLVTKTGSGMLSDKFDFYDALREDVDWLQQFNLKVKGPELSLDQFEKIIEVYEKAAYVRNFEYNVKYTMPMKQAVLILEEASGISNKEWAEAVYTYWSDKRIQFKRALMRSCEQLPDVDDPSPHVAFRPRVIGRRSSTRNPRKNDVQAFQKLRRLGRDFERSRQIAEEVITRESMKLDDTLLGVEILDAEIEQSPFYKKLAMFLQSSDPALVAATDKTRSTPRVEEERAMALDILKLLSSSLPKSEYAKDILQRPKPVPKKKKSLKKRVKPKNVGSGFSDGEDSEDFSDSGFFEDLENVVRGGVSSGKRKWEERELHSTLLMESIFAPSTTSNIGAGPNYIGRASARWGRNGMLFIDRLLNTKKQKEGNPYRGESMFGVAQMEGAPLHQFPSSVLLSPNKGAAMELE